MSEKKAGSWQVTGDSEPFLDSPPQYPGQGYPEQGYAGQPGYVVQGQPGVAPGYVIQPPQYGQTVQCNAQQGPVVVNARQLPHDYLTQAVLVTLCCFFPTGIIAIMRASDARAAASYGDMQTAERHAKSARQMIKISVIAGIVSTIVLMALVGVMYYMAFRNVK